jgi:hypothetical protein
VLGVLAGSKLGFSIGSRSNDKGLQILMAIVLLAAAAIYFGVAGR